MANEFSIKITTDSSGNPVSLDNIPIEAAQALTIFLKSLADVAGLHKDKGGVKISLKKA